MVFLKLIWSFANRLRNYDSFKFFFRKFSLILKKKKSIVILKVLKISGMSNGRFIVNSSSFFEATQFKEIGQNFTPSFLKI